MAEQKSLNELLKWSIINQATEKEDASPSKAPLKPMEKLVTPLLTHTTQRLELTADKDQ
ncbi:hypothetical protein K457DRAFT_137554 [Linnemannia elongata AG-77]|uniref:Uncharacterized protein n=1 Tax=Linnemannia elongata AG-77 TaxID=1314771 RepID=A0A197JWS8_9FUNG|nr:hypothetical protein K457DRAFT_137554 [Linnemannia elongata AG-77]